MSIVGKVLYKKSMYKYGFIDMGSYWVRCTPIGSIKDISIYTTIDKNTKEIKIRIIDEVYFSDYPYMKYLKRNPKHRFSLIVKTAVDKEVKFLNQNNLIEKR